MPVFRYVARDKIGKIHRGQIEADSEKVVELKLQEGGFQLLEISLKSSSKTPRKPMGNAEVVEASMETHGPERANNGVKPNLRLLQIVIPTAVALIGIGLWVVARYL